MIDPSKDKLAYFKNNIQTAEDKEFDASQYYYHREEMSGKLGGLGVGTAGLGGLGLGAAAGTSAGLSMGAALTGVGAGAGTGAGASPGLGQAGFQSMGGLGMGVEDGLSQAGLFGGFPSSGMLMGTSTARSSLGGGLPNAQELHRLGSSDHFASMMKGRSAQFASESKAPDMSEFPALGARMGSWPMEPSTDAPVRSQSSEFTIQKEDFPALSPFSSSSTSASASASAASEKSLLPTGTELKRQASFHSSVNDSMAPQRTLSQSGNTSSIGSRVGGIGLGLQHPVQDSTTNNVNLGAIPAFTLHNHHQEEATATNGDLDPSNKYGLLGMLHSVIRPSNDAKKNLLMGCDLTSLGLNLNASEPLHPIFASPWSEEPLAKEPQYTLPACYYNQPPALKTTHLSKFHLETLFYIFYSMPKDVLQAYAAQELYSRDWRYHTELQLWLKRASAADAALFVNNGANTNALAPPPSPTLATASSIGSIGSIGSAPSSGTSATAAAAAALGSMGPQFLYFDTSMWERRVFTGSLHSISTGLLSEEDIRVHFGASS